MAKKKENIEKQEEPKETPIETGPRKVKLTHEQLMKVQAEGNLVDWNPDTQEALIK